MTAIQEQLISNKDALIDINTKNAEIASAISVINSNKDKELKDATSKIENIVVNNKLVYDRLRTKASAEKLSDDSITTEQRDYLAETYKNLFTESAGLLVEIGKDADISTEIAIDCQSRLTEYNKIIMEINQR